MNLFKKIYCRIFQTVFRIVLPILPYREPEILNKTNDIVLKLKELNIKSVILVTDPRLWSSGITKELEELLRENEIKCVVYSQTMANPTVDNVNECYEMYKREKCEGIIAFGGGSPMDCAKALGALVANPKKNLNQLKGLLRVMHKIPTLIAIPTTAGTGSEVTLAAVITDSKEHHKYTLMDFQLIPRYALLEPKLTYTLPPHLTASTGIDALTHAVEAYIGRSTTKETRQKALEATSLIFNNIKTAYKNSDDYEARKNMLYASYLAGVAFSKSYVGYIHAVAHSLGGQYNIAHGLANAVLMPVVLKKYGRSCYKKLYELALAANVADANDSYEVGAMKFISAIENLNEELGIPKKFNEIVEEDIEMMAYKAEKEANPLYPVPKLMTAKELEKIYYEVKR